MPKINLWQPDGSRYEIDAEIDSSLMEIAVNNNVPGIVAECGGSCSCATCHVYVEEAWLNQLEEPTPEEGELLEFLDGALPNSRLSCQVLVTEELDGLTVRVPDQQE